MIRVISYIEELDEAIKATEAIMDRLGLHGEETFREKCFGFRVELAGARYCAKRFGDKSIMRNEIAQLCRVIDGKITPQDLECDFIVPATPSKINMKGTAYQHLVASKRVDDVCYILGRPADRTIRVTDRVRLPIDLVGWCMGTELQLAPTHIRAPLYCPNLHPMEELWR